MLRFDDFTLDPPTRRLLRAGVEVHLSPKAFDLLVLLIENRARAMSKAELQGKLWPSTFVLETNLASLVAEIRRGLDDPADTPRYIRTMPRFGYWFIGEIRDAAGRAAAAAPAVKSWLIWEARQIPLGDGDNVIGRAADATVWVDAAGVSRRHACIHLDGLEATVEDLGSKNGTYLQGRRVTSAVPLADGDQIRLGSVVMTFRVPPPADATETVQG